MTTGRPKRTSQVNLKGYVAAKEPSRERHEETVGVVRAAEAALAAGECPNGCGPLARARCRACGFGLHDYGTHGHIEPRVPYFREYHKNPHKALTHAR